jgi:hypothetical protein
VESSNCNLKIGRGTLPLGSSHFDTAKGRIAYNDSLR